MSLKDELYEIANYCDDQSVLVMTPTALKRLHCPFKVRCRGAIGLMVKGQLVTVTAIGITLDPFVIFVVNGVGYKHNHFTLLV